MMLNYFMFETRLMLKNMGDIFMPMMFFIASIVIMPFTMNPDAHILHDIASSLIWTALLLSCFLSSDKIFIFDINDGFIDKYPLINIPIQGIFFIKIIVFSLLRIIPIIMILPVIGVLFGLNISEIIRIMIMVIISFPAVTFFAGLGALLSAVLNQGGFFIFMIIFPLILPAIIFGAAGCDIQTPLVNVFKLPLAFSLFSCLMTTILSPFIFKILHQEQ